MKKNKLQINKENIKLWYYLLVQVIDLFFIMTNKSSPRLVLYKKASMMNNEIKNQQGTL